MAIQGGEKAKKRITDTTKVWPKRTPIIEIGCILTAAMPLKISEIVTMVKIQKIV
jgi:hypothetical protein